MTSVENSSSLICETIDAGLIGARACIEPSIIFIKIRVRSLGMTDSNVC